MAIYNGKMVSIYVKGGIRIQSKKGLNSIDFYSIEFKRIPKERILNKLKKLGENVKY